MDRDMKDIDTIVENFFTEVTGRNLGRVLIEQSRRLVSASGAFVCEPEEAS